MSFRFIRDHAGRWPVRLMCRVLAVSVSGYYIEGYYNRRRIHSALGYRTPEQAEQQMA